MTINLDGLPPHALQLISDFMTRMRSKEVASLDMAIEDMQRAGTLMTVGAAKEMSNWRTAYQRVAIEAREALHQINE